MAWQRTLSLPTGCLVKVDEHRAVVELPRTGVARRSSSSSSSGDSIGGEPTEGWNAISSAIWNGGSRSFRCRSSTSNSNSNSNSRSTSNYSNSYENKVCVFNYKVPCTYDGLSPEPRALLRTAIGKERYSSNSYCDEKKGNSDNNNNNNNDNDNGNNNNNNNSLDDKSTVGIMTAASMKSLRTASRSAGGIFVDVVVTAGISNSRTAGADADVFSMLPQQQDERNTGNDSKSSNNKTTATAPQEHQPRAPPPGTINTVVVINGAPLSEGAVVEAYAIAIEAKCAACADFRLPCAKSLYGNDLAQGTGTDCAVLLTPLASPHSTSASTNSTNVPLLEYAGKHCLLAELIGQAVREATREAILSNLIHLHGSLWRYHGHRWKTYFIGLLLRGARPCVPPKPMDSIPPAPLAVLLLGWGMVLVAYGIHVLSPFLLPRSATVLIAATFWDRCLPEPPLSVHPVVLAGTVISIATKQWIPERIFRSPFLGFCGGVLFLLGTLSLFASGAHLFLVAVRWAAVEAATATIGSDDNNIYIFQQHLMKFVSWLLEVMLFKTTFSLQLLCTIALQMARFLERSQLQDARNQLVWLCSRDPTHLGSEDLAGGTLESLSENLSDGTVAPWFWYIVLGPVGALGYRVANTLDSRIGYRGGRYEWFGKASARFDDLINLVPARLTALALVAAAAVSPNNNCSAKRGLATSWEDCSQCSSPNAGWPMGAMAGILGVRLEKKGEYALGKNIPDVRGPTPRDIRNGHHVAQLAGGIAFVAALVACCVKEWIYGVD